MFELTQKSSKICSSLLGIAKNGLKIGSNCLKRLPMGRMCSKIALKFLKIGYKMLKYCLEVCSKFENDC